MPLDAILEISLIFGSNSTIPGNKQPIHQNTTSTCHMKPLETRCRLKKNKKSLKTHSKL